MSGAIPASGRPPQPGRFRAVLEHLDIGVVILDADGVVMHWNARAVAIYEFDRVGTPATTADYRDRYRLIGPDGIELAAEDTPGVRVLRGEAVRDVEVLVQRRDDGWARRLRYGGSLIADDDGRTLGFLSFTDVTESRRAADSLAQATGLLRRTGEMARVGGWEYEIASGELHCTDSAYDIFELERGTPPPHDLALLIALPEYRPMLRESVRLALTEGLAWDHEIEIVTRSGRHVWIRRRGRVELREGRPARLVGIFQDITARKAAELALHAAQDLRDRMIETMVEGVLLLDADGRYTFLNRAAERITGATREEVIGRHYSAPLWKRVARDGVAEAGLTHPFEIVKAGGAPLLGVDTERELRSGERVMVTVNTSPLFDAQGRFSGAVQTLADTTARKAAEAAAQAGESRFRSLIETLPQMVWINGPDGACEYLSPQWVDYTGVPAQRQLGRGWLEQVHAGDREAVARRWQSVLAEGGPMQIEFRVRRHDGEYRWFDSRGVPIRDASGGIVRWIGSNTDIHDRRNADEARLRVQKMEALGTLAGGIAHDFNNILLAIRGNNRLALDDVPASHPARVSLLEVEKASLRAADLVGRILAFSRQQEPRRVTLALRPVVEEALQLLRAALPRSVELRSRFGADVPGVSADSTQVLQMVMNLGANAAHAIGARAGAIDFGLETRAVDAEAAARAGLVPGVHACLSVRDDGCGMDAGTLARVFDPFFTTKPVGEGTGLGLSVVDGIMKAHGGAVTVESTPGAGALFRLWFPAAGAAAAASTEVAARAMAPAAGERILYVDDEEALVLLVSRLLRRAGYTVTGFSDPLGALAHFAAHPTDFDAVVSDLSMPGLPGLALAQELLSIRPDLPVVLISGYLRPEDQAEAARLGVRDLILKPNTVEELGRALDRIFRTG